MLRSMFSGVSGIQSHVQMMDVIGNNIANVNTVGYKSGSMTFRDLISQTVRGASVPGGNVGGTNTIQIGLGVGTGTVDANFSQGSLQNTGRSTDFSIQGAGMFIERSGGGDFYSRAGNFTFDALGNLVNPVNGYIVQGWLADDVGDIDLTNPISDISIPITTVGSPNATSEIDFSGNLPAGATTGEVVTTSIDVFDSQGNSRTLSFTFTKLAADPVGPPIVAENSWDWDVAGPGVPGGTNSGTLVFDSDGSLLSESGGPITFTIPGVDVLTIDPGWGTIGGVDGLHQFSGAETAAALSQDGYESGSLTNFTVGADGTVTGIFSNGQTRTIAQLAIASFSNPTGLIRSGDNLWLESANSGEPDVGLAGTGARGTFIPGTLEMSNVDLSKEFTNMILAQRGFQANSRIVTTADELLQELVNLKR